jgi:hypothetical protein
MVQCIKQTIESLRSLYTFFLNEYLNDKPKAQALWNYAAVFGFFI